MTAIVSCPRALEPSSAAEFLSFRALSRRRRFVATAPGAVFAHHLHQHAFAQTAIGNAQPRTWKRTADRLENRTAGKHEIGAFSSNAGAGHPLFVAHRQKTLDDAGNFRRAHPATVDTVAVVTLKIEMHTRDGRYRSGSAEHVDAIDCLRTMIPHKGRNQPGHFGH